MGTTLDNTFGALFIAIAISACLYGVTCVQAWYYYDHYPLDRWYIKLLVASVFLSETCHQVLICHTAYTYLVTDIAFPLGLTENVWSMIVQVIFNGFTSFFVQTFMVMRVYMLSNKNWFAAGCVMVLVIGQFVMVLDYAAKAMHFKALAQLATLSHVSMSVNVIAATGDALITVFLCFLLHRSRTGFRRSDTLITRLIIYSINTGLLTSLCAIASLVTINAWPGTFIYIAFYWCIGRLYCNSLLATLNVRKGLRSQQNNDNMTLSLQGIQTSSPNSGGTSSKIATNNISIKIDTIQEHIVDDYGSLPDLKPEAV